jgi:hypothetical protein
MPAVPKRELIPSKKGLKENEENIHRFDGIDLCPHRLQ